MGLTNGAILDDLRANFRKWEHDSDNLQDTETLTNILKNRHNVSFNEAYEYAKHWTGYEEINKDEFILVGWPESQTYMEKSWFEDEAVYHPIESGAFFIPKHRI